MTTHAGGFIFKTPPYPSISEQRGTNELSCAGPLPKILAVQLDAILLSSQFSEQQLHPVAGQHGSSESAERDTGWGEQQAAVIREKQKGLIFVFFPFARFRGQHAQLLSISTQKSLFNVVWRHFCSFTPKSPLCLFTL